ncbi:small ribosomal subunit protein mS23 isoform X2 [Narcine bancroftii]|uniref:small ribosomal subunit protein mS23 isoform X2 n=1 Tax=Narcine bancroftii TaxID=1343680 RepID=UPI003831921A
MSRPFSIRHLHPSFLHLHVVKHFTSSGRGGDRPACSSMSECRAADRLVSLAATRSGRSIGEPGGVSERPATGNMAGSRVRDLLRSGVLKEYQKPSWFDVYAAFPPKREPIYQKPKQRFGKAQDPVQEIFYQEDMIRAKFYEMYGNGPRAFDLSRSNFVSTCQRFVEKYQDLEAQGEADEEKLFEGTSRALLAEGIILRRKAGNRIPSKSLPGGVLQEAEAQGLVSDLKSQEAPKDGQEGSREETTQP